LCLTTMAATAPGTTKDHSLRPVRDCPGGRQTISLARNTEHRPWFSTCQLTHRGVIRPAADVPCADRTCSGSAGSAHRRRRGSSDGVRWAGALRSASSSLPGGTPVRGTPAPSALRTADPSWLRRWTRGPLNHPLDRFPQVFPRARESARATAKPTGPADHSPGPRQLVTQLHPVPRG